MAITVISTGNGIAYVSNSEPSIGETVTLYCEPDEGETLLDVYAVDLGGHSIALAVQLVQTFVYNYDGMIITVEFSGTPTPPTPTPSKKKKMPIWMYPVLRQRR